jgi:hypothetical protein
MAKKARLQWKNIFGKLFFYLILLSLCLAAIFLLRCIFTKKYTAVVFLEKYLFPETVLENKNLITVTDINNSNQANSSTTNQKSGWVSLISEIISGKPQAIPSKNSLESPEIIYHPDESLPLDKQNSNLAKINLASSVDPSWFFGSYFNNFISADSIDFTKTNLYRDKTAVSISFQPDYSFENSDSATINQYKNTFTNLHFNNSNGPYRDEICLKNNCLKQQDNNLFYNDKLLLWPDSIKKDNLAAVSIGALTSRWLVGVTYKNNEKYDSQVFYFDGQKFTPLVFSDSNQNIISSPYFGLFGFGGEDNDFLIIYGAYEGMAYRHQGNQISDISQFFPIRVMGGGFKPEIIRTVNNNEVSWYIFSKTLNRPWFMKLWQNGTKDIMGETVLTAPINLGAESVSFKPIKITATEISFLVRTQDNNIDYWNTFKDRGFKNEESGILMFKPISNDASSSPIAIKKIAEAQLITDLASSQSVKFLFSKDSQNWEEIQEKSNVDFLTSTIRNFYLKVTFPSSTNKFYSPFLSSVLFDYYCQRW